MITLCQVTSFLFRNTSYLYLQRQHDNSLKNCYNVGNIRQKGVSQSGRLKKTKHAKFSEKTNISYPLIRTCEFSVSCHVVFGGIDKMFSETKMKLLDTK